VENSGIVVTLAVGAVIVMLVIWLLLLRSARRVNLTRTPEGQKPEWMRTTPPPETIAAAQSDGEGMALYDHKEGENEAAAFAEQIEDILQAQLSADPYLSSYKVDLGTGSDGGLEIRIGDQRYSDVKQIPDERLRAAIGQAVATYNQRDKDEHPSH
jgi:hypothetical protein